MPYRLGVDIGGTFTDFALVNDADGTMAIHKQLTTPEDPSVAVLEGLRHLLAAERVDCADVTALIHGSTLVTNALIERRGAVTGMLVTAGFRDVLDIALELRYDLYDLRLRYPTPLVPRARRYEVAERIRSDGTVERALDLDEVRRCLTELVERHHVTAVAVCFLHAFTNPEHERAVADLAAREFPALYLSTSSDVAPGIREYPRWTTATINAFAQPLADAYLTRLEDGLAGMGFTGKFLIMTSSGGSVTADTARRFPVRMLESGPAAGVLMSAFLGKKNAEPSLLSFDLGGTTAKGAIVRSNLPGKRYEIEVARMHEFKPGSGLPVKLPVVDMIEIGSGGGSIAEIDARGVIRVGPTSAGARPGPACYARGGTRPTLTDANLVLGYLDPRFFLGGDMPLSVDAARDAIAMIGRPLGLSVERAAWGIHETSNEDVVRAFRVHAAERGFDYRSGAMVAFGGGGPIHASRIARKLGIRRVLIPPGAGVMSAVGMLTSPISFELLRSERVALAALTPESFDARFKSLTEEAGIFLIRAGIAADQITIARRLDMRYRGQGYEIEVALPSQSLPALLFAELPALFAAAYEKVFSVSFISEPIEIINWKVEVCGPAPTGERYALVGPPARGSARKGMRKAFFPQARDFIDCPVLDRYSLRAGETVSGPALIEERESTAVLGIGDVARLDEHGSLLLAVAEEEHVQHRSFAIAGAAQ